MELKTLLLRVLAEKGSDLHLSAGVCPMVRIDGQLRAMGVPSLNPEATQRLLYTIMSDRQRCLYEKEYAIDFAYELTTQGGPARFRVHLFRQQHGCTGVFRVIPNKIPTFAELRLPSCLNRLTELLQGLILITGATGMGKTTTLAAMLAQINQNQCRHIITIEDPIEFIHHGVRSLINQRQVYRDTSHFNRALLDALRADPDVICIGELRDLAVIRLALTAAQTGHLVLATLHTTSAAHTINRIVDVFPGEEKASIRGLLSHSLQAVISQILLPSCQGGRVGAYEVMISTPAIRHLIREDKLAQLVSSIQTGQAHGMQTLSQSIAQLQRDQMISQETAKKILDQVGGL